MEKKNILLAIVASVVALLLVGLSPRHAVSIITVIGCLSIVAEIAEPDNALKRYVWRYSKVILTLAVATLVIVSVSLILAVPIISVVIAVLTDTPLKGVLLVNANQYVIELIAIIVFSSFLAFKMVYGGSDAKRWSKVVCLIGTVIFMMIFWRINIEGLPIGQRISKHIAVFFAQESGQMASINQDVNKVYLADYNEAEKTFTSITPQDRILKSGLVVQVRLASPIVMYAEQGFINVIIADNQGEFSLDPQDKGVWLPVKMVTLGLKKVSPSVVAISALTPHPIVPAVVVSQIKPAIVIAPEPTAQLKAPVLEPETNRNTVTVRSDEWVSSRVVNNFGDKIELAAPFKEDMARLEAKINGAMLSDFTCAKQSENGTWTVILNFNSGGDNKNHYPIELRLKYGLPLEVTVQKLEK